MDKEYTLEQKAKNVAISLQTIIRASIKGLDLKSSLNEEILNCYATTIIDFHRAIVEESRSKEAGE